MTAYLPVKVPGRPKRFRIIFGLVLLLIILLGLSQATFRHQVSGVSLKILSPFWTLGRGVNNITIGFNGIFATKLKLEKENVRLRNIIDQQAVRLLNQEILKQENLTLRQIINRAPDPLPLTIGRIINRGQQFPLGLATIDTGLKNEKIDNLLVPGVVVASEGAVALGELTEIYPTLAKMRFYSTTGDRLSGNLGELHIPIELTGRGAGNFIGLLPRDLTVKINDRVTIAVAQHEFIIAVVNDIKRLAGDSFQEVFLRSPINISQLTWVEMYAP